MTEANRNMRITASIMNAKATGFETTAACAPGTKKEKWINFLLFGVADALKDFSSDAERHGEFRLLPRHVRSNVFSYDPRDLCASGFIVLLALVCLLLDDKDLMQFGAGNADG